MSTIKNNQPSRVTSIVCSAIGKILLTFGIVLAVIPIVVAMTSYIKEGNIQQGLMITAISLEFVGILLIFISAAFTTFSKFGLLDFSNPKGSEIIDYPISENKLTKEQLLQEAASGKIFLLRYEQ